MTVMATAKMITYDAQGNRESGRYIVKGGDVCTIKRTIADNLLIEVEFPISAGRCMPYIK